MKKLSIVHPFYDHNFGIAAHVESWNGWGEKFKNNTEIIIVDDGSPNAFDLSLLKKAHSSLDIKVFRILEDIKWNVTGARNLGSVHATGEWVLALDFDMSVIHKTFEGFYAHDRDSKITYWPYLWIPTENRPERTRHPHCNSFFIKRQTLLDSGLYDEDFAGWWGWEDIFFHKSLLPSLGVEERWISESVVRWYRHLACQHVKKEPTDMGNPNYRRYLNKQKQVKRGNYKNGEILRFKWERIR